MNTPWDDDRRARAALSACIEPGNWKFARLIAEHGAPDVWQSLLSRPDETTWTRRAHALDQKALLVRAEGLRLRFLVPGDDEWPTGLDDLAHVNRNELGGTPLGLWAVGPLHARDALLDSVAIVGSRASTTYGEQVSSDLGAELATAGMTIVSGGAYGIDAAAHRGALAVQGATIAFLARGLDAWYPRGNSSLLDRIAENGLVLSEIAPGLHPTKAAFLARNRLIAASSRGSVIVEAAHRSGALNTMAWAKDLGRKAMAVPGPIHSANSLGPHAQIRDNATLVTGSQDIRTELAPMQPDLPFDDSPTRPTDGLEGDLLAVREALPSPGSAEVADLVEQTGLRWPAVLGALATLEVRGLARLRPDGRWALARPD